MEKWEIFRLEFNEKQQQFHSDNFTHEANTHGWFTIFDYCTDNEFHIYEAYVKRIPKKTLTKEYLLKCATEVEAFMDNLSEKSLVIRYNK